MGKHHAAPIKYGWRTTQVWTGRRNQLLLEGHDVQCWRFAELEGLKFSDEADELPDVRADLECRAAFANATVVQDRDRIVGVLLGGCLTGLTEYPCRVPVGYIPDANLPQFMK